MLAPSSTGASTSTAGSMSSTALAGASAVPRPVSVADAAKVPRSFRHIKNKVIAEAGRPPWYRADGKAVDSYIIGIAGGSSSGKTYVASEILKRLNVPWALVLSQDNFYKSLSPEQSKRAFENMHDFDCPEAFDADVLFECVQDLKANRACQIPNYSFVRHQRTDETTYIYGGTVIIVEGIFVLHDPRLRDLCDLKVFVQCDSDLMLARRIRRDIVERARDPNGILDQYLRFVKPSFDEHVLPTQRHADVIVPGLNNERAIGLITDHIRCQLDERSMRVRSELSRLSSRDCAASIIMRPEQLPCPGAIPESVLVMEQTPQLRGIHTIIRNASSSRIDLIHFVDRLATRIVEQALELLPYTRKDVVTGTPAPYSGAVLDIEPGYLCGVSVLRSGAPLERGLRRGVRDAAIGSMLIQSDTLSGEPLLYTVNLPAVLTRSRQDASQAYVLLLDSQIGTGASAFMALRILLDHGVREDHIIICCLVVSRVGGIWAIRRAFPDVRIVTSAVDDDLQETWSWAVDPYAAAPPKQQQSGDSREQPDDEERSAKETRKRIYAIMPGMGSLGDRYFGA